MTVIDLYHRIANSRTFEQLQPYLLGLVAAVICYMQAFEMPDEQAVRLALLGGSITVGSIMSGFMTTAMVLLLNFEGARKRAFDDSGFTRDVIRYLIEAIYISLGFAALNLAGFFAPGDSRLMMAAWLGICVTMLLAFRRVFVLLVWLMEER